MHTMSKILCNHLLYIVEKYFWDIKIWLYLGGVGYECKYLGFFLDKNRLRLTSIDPKEFEKR